MKFQVGDRVVITSSQGLRAGWKGVEGVVVRIGTLENDMGGSIEIKPDMPRPDGHERMHFWWPQDAARLIQPPVTDAEIQEAIESIKKATGVENG